MKYKYLFLSFTFVLALLVFLPQNVSAAGWCAFDESDPSECCTSAYPGGDCNNECVEEDRPCWRIGSACIANDEVLTAISNATGIDKVYNCSTGLTKCRPNYENCAGTCQEIVPGLTCGGCPSGSISYPKYLNDLRKMLNPSAEEETGCKTLWEIVEESITTITAILGLTPPPPECDNDGNWEPANNELCDDGSGGEDATPNTGDCRNCVWYGTDPVCGNGSVESGEQCDDANTDPGDGCDENCFKEIDLSSLLISNLNTDGADEGQVITNVGGTATWSTPAAGAVAGTYLGISNDGFTSGVGYNGVNGLCNATYPGSHVCTSAEILNYINAGGNSNLGMDPEGQVWISNGPPAFTANANDCLGWTMAGSTSFYGTFWTREGDYGVGGLTTCDKTFEFACCG